MRIITFNVNSVNAAKKKLNSILNEFVYKKTPQVPDQLLSPISPSPLSIFPKHHQQTVNVETLKLGLVIDGESLTHVFSDLECMKLFSMISCLCLALICCRVSPLQKAQVVKLVKNHFSFKPMTLAIGDGANDVSMIQEAHVGIGVCGKEGLQAVNSSDYAIGRFKFLLPLLLLHGRWNYQRISIVILYSFYKNFLLVLPMFYYSFSNQYSGTALYDSWLIMSYNVALTAVPVIILGVLDKDLTSDEVLSSPKLYHIGIFSQKFSAGIFLKWTAFAVVHSLLIYYLITLSAGSALSAQGHPENQVVLGAVAFYCVVQTASYMILLEMKDWTWMFLAVLFLSNYIYFGYVYAYDSLGLPTGNLIGVFKMLFEYPVLTSTMWLVPVACVLFNLSGAFIQTIWFSTRVDQVRTKRHSRRVYPQMIYREQDLGSDSKQVVPMRAAQFAGGLEGVFLARGYKVQSEHREDKTDVSLKPYTLRFNSQFIERDYQLYRTLKIVNFTRNIFLSLFAMNLLWTVASFLTTEDLSAALVASRVTVVVFVLLLVLFVHTKHFVTYYENVLLTVILVSLISKTFLEVMSSSDGSMSTAIVLILTFVLFDIATYKVLAMNLVFLFIYFIRTAWHYSLEESYEVVLLLLSSYVLLLLAIALVSAFVGYNLEKTKRLKFILLRHLKFQFKKGQEILATLLPKFVRDRVRQGIRYIAEDKGVVTVVFCDICNFDRICATHTPNELLDLLDKFFNILDKLCEKHGITKIETVNKTYMACGGLKDSEENLSPEVLAKNHAVRSVEFALEILQKIQPVYLKNGDKFQVKIGINSGPVVAGVVGEQKPQFSLVGDTVNTASRMCSTIHLQGKVQISYLTYAFVKDMDWDFESREIVAKGKGKLEAFYVARRGQPEEQRRMTIYEQIGNFNRESGHLVVRENSKLHQRMNTEYAMLEIEKNNNEEDMKKPTLAGPVHWLNCSFKELRSQLTFRVYFTELHMDTLLAGLWGNIGIYAGLLVFFIINVHYKGIQYDIVSTLQILIRSLSLASLVYLALSTKRIYQSYMFPWALTMVYISIGFSVVLSVSTLGTVFIYESVLELMHTNLILNHVSCLPFGFILIGSSITLVHWFSLIIAQSVSLNVTIEATFFLMIFMLLNGAVSFFREKQDRVAYNLNKLAQQEIRSTDTLLQHMMPRNVVNNLKNDIITTDKYQDVTIIFADIVGFTNWSSGQTPLEIINMLSKLFSTFDNLCVVHGVYKVHTIGDCYVLLSFSNDDREDEYDNGYRNVDSECVTMINMALEMLKSIKRINRKKQIELNMRIGVHTGEVIGGISGTNIVRYDIYGPDVDIANKMESEGSSGFINISEVTRGILERTAPGRFEYKFNRKIIHEPTNRDLLSYFLSPLQNEDIE